MRIGWRVAVFVVLVAVVTGPVISGVAVSEGATQTVGQVSGEPPPERWNETYGATQGSFNEVTVTTEGTLLAVGSRLSAAGTDLDALVVNKTIHGTDGWSRTYGSTGDDVIRDAVPTRNGGALLVGSTVSPGSNQSDGWVLRIDRRGSVQWRLATGGPGGDKFTAVQRTRDGYLLVGSYSGANTTDGWLVELQPGGAIVGEHRYNVGLTASVETIEPRPRGGYVLAGETSSRSKAGSDAFSLVVGPDGTKFQQQIYDRQFSDRVLTAQAMPDGGMLLAGATRSLRNASAQGWVIRLDDDDWERWNRTYDTGPLTDVIPTSEDSYLFASSTRDASTPTDGLALHLWDTGTEVWHRTYGGRSYESFAGVTLSPDGGYVLAGVSGTDRGQPGTSWLVKLGGLERPEPTPTTTTPPNTTSTAPTAPTAPTTSDTDESVVTTTATDEGGLPLSLLGAGLVVCIFLAGFLILLWDLADDPLGALDKRTPIIDLTVIVNRITNTAPAGAKSGGAEPAGGGPGFDETGETATESTEDPMDMGGDSTDLGDDSMDLGDDEPTTDTDADVAVAPDPDADADTAADDEDDSSVPTTQAPVPGTFVLRNVGDETLLVRFRCNTMEEVIFDYWVDIKPGQTRAAHATPIDEPFEILINVADELFTTEVFVNRGRRGDDVTATVGQGTIDISHTAEIDDEKLARARERVAEREGIDATVDPALDDESTEPASEDSEEWTPDIDVVDPDEADAQANDTTAAGGAETATADAAFDDGATDLDDGEMDDLDLSESVDPDPMTETDDLGADVESPPDAGMDDTLLEESDIPDQDDTGDAGIDDGGDLGMDEAGDLSMDDSGGGGGTPSFDDLKDEYEDGDAEWAEGDEAAGGDDLEMDESSDLGMDDGGDDLDMDDGGDDLSMDDGDGGGGTASFDELKNEFEDGDAEWAEGDEADGGDDLGMDDGGDDLGMDDGGDDFEMDEGGDDFGMDDGDDFGMDDGGDGFEMDDGGDDFGMDDGDDDLGMDDGGDDGGGDDGDKSFAELKKEFEEGDADWADDDDM